MVYRAPAFAMLLFCQKTPQGHLSGAISLLGQQIWSQTTAVQKFCNLLQCDTFGRALRVDTHGLDSLVAKTEIEIRARQIGYCVMIDTIKLTKNPRAVAAYIGREIFTVGPTFDINHLVGPTGRRADIQC